ncbi:MAG: flagellar basal-body MS-ring/collar protein FliF [Steroidobacteraceae bacterium]
MAENALTVPGGVLDTVPGLRQVVLLVGVAVAIAAAVWLVMWSQGQSYTVLYGQLSERETGQVMDALTAAGIEFKLNPAGAVMVPEPKVQEARIRLASQGLPQSDAMGIEMIQKEGALGTSSLMEAARYQSALETELARTIAKVQGVQGARVHLAIPKPSVFVRDQRKPTASVMLQLYPGRRLDPGQVAAIVHLTASSVPELESKDVTVVDQAGTLLNSPEENGEAAVSTRQFEYTRKLEDSYQRRIVEILEPILGAGRVRATVTADMDFTVTEQARENYDPQKTVVRSEQLANDERKGGIEAQGIPGALTNQPPGTAGTPPAGQPATTASTTSPTSSSSRSTKNFEVDRVLSYIKQPVGTIKRLSIGVVLDDWQKLDKEGKVSTSPMTDADIKRFTELVRESVGFRADRNDQISVINQSFKPVLPEGAAEGPGILQQPWLSTLAKQAVGVGLVLLVAFLVLKPLMSSLTKPSVRAIAGTGRAGAEAIADGGGGGSKGQAITLAPSFEQQVAAARSLVISDPKRAAQVVKEWVATDG